jgi:hypothetical protein
MTTTLESSIQRANDKRKALGLDDLDLMLDEAKKKEPKRKQVNCGSLGRISLACYRGSLKKVR